MFQRDLEGTRMKTGDNFEYDDPSNGRHELRGWMPTRFAVAIRRTVTSTKPAVGRGLRIRWWPCSLHQRSGRRSR